MEPSLPLKDSYTVGWIAALSIELTAAIRMLDARYSYPIDFVKNPNDTNVYVWGKIGDHNVVIAFLEEGAYGTTPAAITATYLLSALPNIKIGLLVGIGAGIRRKDLGIDVRLGDVVISEPDGKSGGVYQYDLLKARAGNYVETTGVLNRPSTFLLKVLKLVKAQHLAGQSKVPEYLRLINPEMANPPNGTPGFVHQGLQNDRLFKSTFLHVSAPTGAEHSTRVDLDADDSDSDSSPEAPNSTCPHCPQDQEVKRKPRKSGSTPQFHYGTIASGNTLVKDADERDRIVKRVPGNCICFEMEAAGLMNNFPCLVIRGICDYADSHKNDRWQPYAALTAAAYAKEFLETVPGTEVQLQTPLAQQLDEIAESINVLKSTTAASSKKMMLENLEKWLSPPDTSTYYLAAISERENGAVGTGRWILGNKKFLTWKNSSSKSFLWLHGLAGCGKTVLCSTVIEHLNDNKFLEHIVLYYFFSFKDAHTRSQRSLIGSLVMQLCQQDERAMQDLFGLLSEERAKHLSDRRLLEVFNLLAAYFGCTMIVIDGLDEVEKKQRSEILHWIRGIMASRASSDIRILASSRSMHDIETKLGCLDQTLLLHPEFVQKDIDEYVHKQVYDMESGFWRWRQKPHVRKEIEAVLKAKARGMFRWVVCQMDALEECVDYRSLYETLNSLPETLDETYERMIRILLKRNQTSGILLLQFLVFAERHLWIDEAVDIIAVDLKSSPHFQERYRMPNELEISSICSSLVTVGMVESTTLGAVERTGRTLQLAHFSVKEYLMSDRLPSILQQHFTEVNAHGSIVNTSLGYLTSVLSSYKDDRTTLEMTYPFLRYAGKRWPTHAILGEKNHQTLERIKAFLKDESKFQLWLFYWNRSQLFMVEPPSQTLNVLLAIDCRLEATAISLITEAEKFDTGIPSEAVLPHLPTSYPFTYLNQRSSGRSLTTPLYLASSRGLCEAVRVLVARGMDIQENGGMHGTPLNDACYSRNGEAFKLLLELSDKSRDDYHEYLSSALGKAVCMPHLSNAGRQGVYRLIDICVHLKNPGSSLDSCLKAALVLGDMDLTRDLLRKGAHVSVAAQYISQLFWKGEKSILHTLRTISKGCSENSTLEGLAELFSGREGEYPPAHGACRRSFDEVLHFLVSHGAKRHTLDVEGMTPLIVAVISGNKKAVEILLDMSPLKSTGDFKAINEAKYGFIDIPEKALSRTALHLAAERGSTEIARLLLIGGANVRAMDIFGGSPIHIAAEEHNLEIVQLLVEYGSDLKACDSEGRTPLRCARDSLTFGLAGARNEVVEWLEYMEGRG